MGIINRIGKPCDEGICVNYPSTPNYTFSTGTWKPVAIFMDPYNGNLYVNDYTNYITRCFDSSFNELWTIPRAVDSIDVPYRYAMVATETYFVFFRRATSDQYGFIFNKSGEYIKKVLLTGNGKSDAYRAFIINGKLYTTGFSYLNEYTFDSNFDITLSNEFTGMPYLGGFSVPMSNGNIAQLYYNSTNDNTYISVYNTSGDLLYGPTQVHNTSAACTNSPTMHITPLLSGYIAVFISYGTGSCNLIKLYDTMLNELHSFPITYHSNYGICSGINTNQIFTSHYTNNAIYRWEC